ncbi:hypothetical protein E3983_12595 [Legionella israelensis]|uniref:Lipoprotein n=1 Tax=Legionella israelensis TaxID=454 RepID=A0AAX1EJ97_9GAMM|nr:lipoprotein [Legionella israelensis]QBR85114.1 hypothetical protein E3983_12595 [Legionella israelensis]QBS09992.1 hypothetical protein E4T55_09070 [Legionella israelensis]QDP71195.1 lipoprotein [Legionella israelensis]SCX77799.1 lipoprotein-attachment site-containing protein [Legionella israelensis DSM 19235]STX59567.1 Predicted small periplasmic lipoprotein [Legionella israelensis]
MKSIPLIFIVFAGLFLVSCGQKGPLYLPGEPKNNAYIVKE